MFATQLIRILDTLPSPAKNANCVFDTDELHGDMKENQNGILFHHKNSPGRYSDPVATEINNKDRYWNTPELECAIVMDDFMNVNGSEIKRSHVFEKETDMYTDINVMECELPELMICYKESGAYHVVKDICVDEGKHSQENNLMENFKDDKDKCDGIIKESLGTESFTQDRLRSSSERVFGLNTANKCGTQEKDFALLTYDSQNHNSDLGEKGDHTEPLIQDGSELENEDEEKGQGQHGHFDMSERNTDTKSLLEDGPQLSILKEDCDATDQEFGTKLIANIEFPIAKGIQESSDDSDEQIQDFSECGPALNIDQDVQDNCGPGDVVQTFEEDNVPAIDKLMYDASAEESDSNSMSSGKTYRPQTSLKFLLNSSEFGIDDDDEQPLQIPMAEISKISYSVSDTEEVSSSSQASNLMVNNETESEINGLNLDTENAAAISEEESSAGDRNLPIEDNNLDNLTKAEQYNVGETSFSVAGPIEGLPTYVGPIHEDETSVVGPVSARITYSGPIPFSGNISLRSESSAASTRSFAFPV